MSTKSYKLRSGGREELQDFGNPSEGSIGSPLLWKALKFDVNGRLIEDFDLDGPLIEQESYRYVYKYDDHGVVVERSAFRNDAHRTGKEGKRIQERDYSSVGRIKLSSELDDHGNVTSVEWYDQNGKIKQKQNQRYEYLIRGNTLEQIYYPPSVPPGVGIMAHPPLGAGSEESGEKLTPEGYRTVFVRDDEGRVRDESRYYCDGSLMQKNIFDQNGILRSKEWRLADAIVTTTIFDDKGREIESHTTAKEGIASERAVDERTLCSHDEYGNLTKMITRSPDGWVVCATTNEFEYDDHRNWVQKTETELNNTWKTQPFPAAFETIGRFRRVISYFPDK